MIHHLVLKISILLAAIFFCEGHNHLNTWSLNSLGSYSLQDHSHESILDPNEVITVFWTPDLENKFVTWEIHARTKGWIGFGLSPHGGMNGADIITAWVRDGQLHLQDRHGIGNTLPPVDDHQDWIPHYAAENDTHTIIVVSRDIDTCDNQDFPLTNETIRLIYAYGNDDPDDNYVTYHGNKRGARVALPLLPFHQPPPPPNAKMWKVEQSRSLPSNQSTLYWCTIEKVPHWEVKHHYIGFQMVYGENSRSHLHHAVAFECHTTDGSSSQDLFEKHVGHEGYECYIPSMPKEFFLCERFLINWGIGSEGEMLPDHVGFPMGDKHGGSTYLLFQTHYDNPGLIPDVTVSWGMNLYYTDQIRSEDASILSLGHTILFSLTIPPNVPRWDVSGHCAPVCTFNTIPKEGIRVFTVFLHGHYLTKVIRLRHFRHGKELPLIAQDRYFDPNFQQSRRLHEEVVIYPGDHLVVECQFNSTNRNKTTYSGWDARDEMCQAFLNYYPRMKMALCRSYAKPDVITNALGIPPIKKNKNFFEFIMDTELVNGDMYQNSINNVKWTEKNITEINHVIQYSPHMVKCQYNNGDMVQVYPNFTKYPENIKPYESQEEVCSLKKNNRHTYGIKSRKRQPNKSSAGTSAALSSHYCIIGLYLSVIFIL